MKLCWVFLLREPQKPEPIQLLVILSRKKHDVAFSKYNILAWLKKKNFNVEKDTWCSFSSVSLFSVTSLTSTKASTYWNTPAAHPYIPQISILNKLKTHVFPTNFYLFYVNTQKTTVGHISHVEETGGKRKKRGGQKEEQVIQKDPFCHFRTETMTVLLLRFSLLLKETGIP